MGAAAGASLFDGAGAGAAFAGFSVTCGAASAAADFGAGLVLFGFATTGVFALAAGFCTLAAGLEGEAGFAAAAFAVLFGLALAVLACDLAALAGALVAEDFARAELSGFLCAPAFFNGSALREGSVFFTVDFAFFAFAAGFFADIDGLRHATFE